MAIALLREQRKEALAEEFKAYLPELVGYPGSALGHLLTRTSGLPESMNLLDGVFDKFGRGRAFAFGARIKKRVFLSGRGIGLVGKWN